jgi:hypothetical protein
VYLNASVLIHASVAAAGANIAIGALFLENWLDCCISEDDTGGEQAVDDRYGYLYCIVTSMSANASVGRAETCLTHSLPLGHFKGSDGLWRWNIQHWRNPFLRERVETQLARPNTAIIAGSILVGDEREGLQRRDSG